MNDATPAASLLNTRQHYEVLDGLRGVAAIAVVVFHFMEIAVPDYNNNFIAHAYLAVDFFFCLSGFVIAYAYDRRLHLIGKAVFFKLRLIRLHPLVVIGSIIGLVGFVFDPFTDLLTKYGHQAWLLFGTSCLMIPYPVVKERFFNNFHLNAPAWSLFWEYVANIFYAFVLVKVRNKILWALVVIAAGCLFYESHKSNYIGVGWDGNSFMGGFFRVFFSFLAGILVYRLGWIIRTRLGFFFTSVLLLVALLFPFTKSNWIVDPLIVVLYFPLVVALGAGATPHPRLQKFCQFFGELSYPLYMVHYPFIWLFLSYVEKYKPSLAQMTPIIIIGTLFLIGFAYIVLIFIDEPIRRYLKSRMQKPALSIQQ